MKALAIKVAAASFAVAAAGCVAGRSGGECADVSVGTVRHMSETLDKNLDDPVCERIVEAFSGGDDDVCAPFAGYIAALDEMMASGDTGYQYNAVNVLKIIRRPTAWAMMSVADKDEMRVKTLEWVRSALGHPRADVRERALAVLGVLPRAEVDAIVAAAEKDGVRFERELGKCAVCEKGKVTVSVDLGPCPACGGKVVRAANSEAAAAEKKCSMCHGVGRRMGILTAVCEHCFGEWDRCPALRFPGPREFPE